MKDVLFGKARKDSPVYELTKQTPKMSLKIGTKYKIIADMDQDILMLEEVDGDGVLRIPKEALKEYFK